jgi:hypothetical protein
MLKGFWRFYEKEKWLNKYVEIQNSLYEQLQNIVDNEIDTSINKLVDACIENYKVVDDKIIIYSKVDSEVNVGRTIRIRESMWNKLEDYRNKYGISIIQLINISIRYTLDNN